MEESLGRGRDRFLCGGRSLSLSFWEPEGLPFLRPLRAFSSTSTNSSLTSVSGRPPLAPQPSPQEVLVALVLNLEPGEVTVAAGLWGVVMGETDPEDACLLGGFLIFSTSNMLGNLGEREDGPRLQSKMKRMALSCPT